MPEKVNGRRFAGKAAAKLFENIIDRDEDLMIPLDVFFVVRLVFVILGKRLCRGCFVRHCPDLRFDSELCEIGKNAGVEIGDRQPVVKRKILVTAVARFYLESMFLKVELDLKAAA